MSMVMPAGIYERICSKLKASKADVVKRIIKKHNTQLIAAIISRVNYAAMIANDLYNANLLSERYFLEMIPYVNKTDPEMDIVFASSIVTQLRVLLYDDPEAFLDVMTILKKHSPMDEVAIKMEREYCKLNYVYIRMLVCRNKLPRNSFIGFYSSPVYSNPG